MDRRSPAIAAFLSFIWPGLGHLYIGRRRGALVFALPAVIATLALLGTLLTGIERLVIYAITPSGTFTSLVLVLVTGFWRLIAIVDAANGARRSGGVLHAGSKVIVAAVVLAVLGTHASAAYVAYLANASSNRIFVASGPDDGVPDPTGSPGSQAPTDASPSPTDEYLATPLVTPAPKGRVTILLTGIDSAQTRTTSLTDTILVVSINPNDGTVAMLSVPRDISEFPLYNGRRYMGKINSLMTWARNHPRDYPDGPLPTLMQEVGYLIGIPINYYAAIDLAGFRKMIDVVGGVTVNNDRAINDPRYEWLDGTFGFSLPAGQVTLNGRDALAFVRSRQGIGDSDFTRAARQQELLIALRRKLTSLDMVPRIPEIIAVAGDTIRTNIPADRLQDLMDLAQGLDDSKISRYVLGPPYAVHPPTDTTNGIYILRLDLDRMAALSVRLFGSDSRYATP